MLFKPKIGILLELIRLFKNKKVLTGAAIAALFCLLISGLFLTSIIKSLPDPESLGNRRVAQSTKIYDRTGKILLYEIYGEEKRTLIHFSEIPDHVKQATIAIEDAGFYEHSAFDLRSILRAVIVNLSRGRITQGGSTITQQLAKNAFLTPERTFTRKIKELALAILLEKRYSKQEILNLYLNQIPYGANAYGIEAAAQTYFKKSAKDLNIAESALLASLPKAPSYYSPWGNHVKELMKRKDYTLEQMAELDFIDEQQEKSAQKHKLIFAPQNTGIKAPHFVISVQEYLNGQYGEDFVRTAGLEVITTLDWPLQEIAEKIVFENAKRNEELYQGKNAALVAQDAATGQIFVLVGSRDYFDKDIDGNFNVAVQGLRQPGSAIKPFIYLTAFKKGYTPETVVFDLKTEFDATGDPEKSYQPENFDEKFRGPVTLRQALAQSINVPAVKTLYLSGIDNVLKTVRDFGISTLTERSRYGLSLVLGGGEVKLIELVGAYSVLAQEGIKNKQTFVLKITDQNGKVLEEYINQPEEIIEPQYPKLINDILSDTHLRSALFQNSLGLTIFPDHEVALKTGTTNDYRDAWAIGYTPTLTVGVWAGNNDNQPMQKRGSSILAAIPMWNSFMNEALKNRSPKAFNKPDPIFTDKLILRGEYIINNQIHEILYHVNKNNPLGSAPQNPDGDPQFKNWEEPVIEWLKTDPLKTPLLANIGLTNSLILDLKSPANGSLIANNLIPVEIKALSPSGITKLEVFFNNKLVSQNAGNFGNDWTYKNTIAVDNVKLQNLFKVVVSDSANRKSEKEIILFNN